MRQQPFSLRLLLLALLAFSPLAGHGQQQPTEVGPGVERQVAQWVDPCLRLRSGASLGRSILECLEPGTRLRVLGETSGWSQVRLLDGTQGWVDSGFLEVVGLAPAPRSTPAGPRAGSRPAASAAKLDDLRGQIAALEGQLEAMSALRAATEERLRETVAAAEQAQIEAGRLGQRVRDLERQREAAGSDRAETFATELEAGRARIAELEQALAASQGQVLRAAELNAEQERRIEVLDAARADGRASEAELRQALAAADTRARAGEESGQTRAKRIAELEAELSAIRQSETELRQALAAADTRARAGEESGQTRAKRIAELEAELSAIRQSETELRQALVAAEQAQIEAGRLGQRVLELERQREAAGSARAETLAAELEAGRARIAELEQALAAAEGQLLRAAELNAEQERRIEALDAAQADSRAGEAELRQALAAAETRARSTEDSRQALANRIAQLQAELQTVRGREAQLGDDVTRLEARLQAAELTRARQNLQIDELTGRLATAEAEPAAVPVADLAAPGEPPTAAEPSPAAPIPVQEPIVAAPQPPPAAVSSPLAMEPAEGEAAAAAPAPGPGEATPPDTEAAMDTVRAWAAAWSDQRVEDYLGFYATGFHPANGVSRAAWEAQRTERLTRPSYIRVTISSLGAERAPDGTVRATFRQDYESDRFADTVTKVLTLAEQDGVWRILAERAEP